MILKTTPGTTRYVAVTRAAWGDALNVPRVSREI